MKNFTQQTNKSNYVTCEYIAYPDNCLLSGTDESYEKGNNFSS